MALGILGSEEEESEETEINDEEFVELDAEMAEEAGKVSVRAETLQEVEDVEKIQELLRANTILWVNIKPLKQRDMTKLKRAVKRLKKTVRSIDGDVAGVDEDYIILTPSFAEIERSGDVEEA